MVVRENAGTGSRLLLSLAYPLDVSFLYERLRDEFKREGLMTSYFAERKVEIVTL